MKKYDIAVIDFETMNEHTNSPCQVAISLIKDLSVEYIYNSYINPPNNFYSQENANIHQIPKEVILTAPSFDSIFDKIEKLLNESFFVVAHNANFDISVLNHTANTYNLTPKNFLYIDSVNIFKYFHQNISVSMNSLCDIYNIEKSGLHSAKYDVEALSKLLISLMKNEGFSSFLELIQSMKTQYIRFSKLANVQYTIKKTAFTKSSVKITDINKLKIEYNNLNLMNKNIVFTGEFENSKEKLMIQSRKNGAKVRSNVSAKTNILVEGIQNEKYVDENGLVSKQRKARAYKNQGVDIQIINEQGLISLLKGEIND